MGEAPRAHEFSSKEGSMVAKRFFYVCAGLLCLALAYHLGATSARSQPISSAIEAASCYDSPVGGYDVKQAVINLWRQDHLFLITAAASLDAVEVHAGSHKE